MKKHWKRTFRCLELPDESRERILSVLTDHMKNPEKVSVPAGKRSRRLRLPLVAAAIATAAALAGFAYGEKIFPMLGGGRIMQYINEYGEDVVSVDTGFAVDPVVITDGRVYFTLDGSYRDITDQCSATTCYRYESTDPDGTHHTILVGGSIDHIGWAETTTLPDGSMFSNATYDSEEPPLWLNYRQE